MPIHSKPSLSVLIVSFNCWNHLDACIRSILASSLLPSNIVVIDNASVDGTVENMNKHYPSVMLIRNPENVGHTKAVNQGLRVVQGEYILLLDADTALLPECIQILIDFLENNTDVWMVVPRVYYPDGGIQESARNFPTALSGLFGRQSLMTRLFPNNRLSIRYLARHHLDAIEPFQAEFVAATCMLFRRKILHDVGLWDEEYNGYWVDADWCKRIGKANGLIYCIPAASLIHHEQNRRSLKKSPSRIISFHSGAYRLYCLHYTRGPWDPRRYAAALLLIGRTIALLGTNALKSSGGRPRDPLEIKKISIP